MDLLLRLVGIIVRSAISIFIRLAVLLLRLLLRIAHIILGWMFKIMMFSFLAAVDGPKNYIDRHAREWTRRLLDIGVSRDHLDISHRISRTIIAGMIVIGWGMIVAGMALIVVSIVWIMT